MRRAGAASLALNAEDIVEVWALSQTLEHAQAANPAPPPAPPVGTPPGSPNATARLAPVVRRRPSLPTVSGAHLS
jgi:hypothetical protein